MFYWIFVAFICFTLEYDVVDIEVGGDDHDEDFQDEELEDWYGDPELDDVTQDEGY